MRAALQGLRLLENRNVSARHPGSDSVEDLILTGEKNSGPSRPELTRYIIVRKDAAAVTGNLQATLYMLEARVPASTSSSNELIERLVFA